MACAPRELPLFLMLFALQIHYSQRNAFTHVQMTRQKEVSAFLRPGNEMSEQVPRGPLLG